MNWKDWLIKAISRLSISNSSSAKSDAKILLAHVTGASHTYLLAFGETLLTDTQHAILEILLSRRERGEPIAYLTGECEFWSLPLYISADTMIPRPDTECLVQCALDLVPSFCIQVLDLGTGSGAIALALASERPMWKITGIDRLQGVVALARINANRLELRNVQFQKDNWFSLFLKQRYHLIVSNPPYIKMNDPHLTEGDLRFEPLSALVAMEDGLQDLSAICCIAGTYLEYGGWLVLEHSWCQGPAVRGMLSDAGFNNIVTLRDYGGNERVSYGQWLIR